MDTRQALLLRIHTDETAMSGPEPVHELVVRRAREARLAGATVLRAVGGYAGGPADGGDGAPVTINDRGLVVEVFDSETKIEAFAESLGDMSGLGVLTLQPILLVAPSGRSEGARAGPA